MNRKKSDPKAEKTLIRYPEDYHPRYVSVHQLHAVPTETPIEQSVTTLPELVEPKIPDISSPVINSSLCIKKRMKKVEQQVPRRVKNVCELSEVEKVSIDEKITRRINFPFDKKLYKQLISLKFENKPAVQLSAPIFHEPIIRDNVPKLEDFYTPPLNKEYSILATSTFAPSTTTKNYNGTRLHKVINTWKDNRID